MIEKIEGIVLETIRHNDRQNVVSLFVRRRGRVPFLVPASGSGRGSRLRQAALMPLAIVEGEVKWRVSGQMQKLPVPTPGRIWRTLYFNPLKSAVVMFLSEFLNTWLRVSEGDEGVWRYITGSLAELDSIDPAGAGRRIANFHLGFLIGLMPLAGIMPPSPPRNPRGMALDMLSGEYVASYPLRPTKLTEEETAALGGLLRMNVINCGAYRLSREERHRILERLLAYYSLHFSLRGEFKSPAVLAEVFG